MSYPYIKVSREKFAEIEKNHYSSRQLMMKGIVPGKIDSRKDFFKKYIMPVRVWVEGIGPRVMFPREDVDLFLENKNAITAAEAQGLINYEEPSKKCSSYQRVKKFRERQKAKNEKTKAIRITEEYKEKIAFKEIFDDNFINNLKQLIEGGFERMFEGKIRGMESGVQFYRDVVSELHHAIREYESRLGVSDFALLRIEKKVDEMDRRLTRYFHAVCSAQEFADITGKSEN